MRKVLALLGISSIIFVGSKPVSAITTTLYNGIDTPESQGWLAPGAIQSDGTPIFDISAFQSGDETTPITIQTRNIDKSSGATNTSGYLGYTNQIAFPPSYSELNLVNREFPELNANEGYSIFFDVALDRDNINDSDPNRAAFSLIAISSDVTKGIELDFDTDGIFAQSAELDGSFSEFIKLDSESISSFSTTESKNYELRINNSSYELFANNTSLITGALKDYEYNTAATDPNLPFDPYETPNFIYFGDLSDRASGEFTLGTISVDTASVPFEFSPTLGLVLAGIGITASKIYKSKKLDL